MSATDGVSDLTSRLTCCPGRIINSTLPVTLRSVSDLGHWGRNHLQLLSATRLRAGGSCFCSETAVSEMQPVPRRDKGCRVPRGSAEFGFGPILPVGICHFLHSSRSTHGSIKAWDNLVLQTTAAIAAFYTTTRMYFPCEKS